MTAPATEQPGRYQRSPAGLIGALLLLLVVIGGFVAMQAVFGGQDATAVRSVDYAPVVRQARSEHLLLVSAPDPMPSGWRATSVSYQNGADPRWHLGMLTDQQRYVAIEESTESEQALADRVLAGTSARGGTVRVGGLSWRVWTGGGDYALVRRTPTETVLIGGSAGKTAVQRLAAQLSSGTVAVAK